MTRCNVATSPVSPADLRGFRERPSTSVRHTASRWRHAVLATLLFASVAACGGKRTDSYKKATSQQEQCCDHLMGAGRDECLSQIVRVSDPNVAASDANQATFRCVEDHFTCDPASGHATQASAQQQYDCIAELGQ